jgi:hypothetical protein
MFLGYIVVDNLWLQFMVYVMLFPTIKLLYLYISTFRSMCAVPNMAVFCSYLMMCFRGVWLMHILNDSEMAPAAPVFTGITFVFTFHMRRISIVRSLCFKYFQLYF